MSKRFRKFILLTLILTVLSGMNVYAKKGYSVRPARVTKYTKYDVYDVTDMNESSLETYFGSGVTTTETENTGLFESQLSGYALKIYQGLSSVTLTPDTNGVSFSTTAGADQSVTDIYYLFRNAYVSALYAYERDHQDEIFWAGNSIKIGGSYCGKNVTITVSYVASGYCNSTVMASVKAKVNAVVNGCTASSRKDKVKYYHDWLVANNSYDMNYAYVSSNDGTRDFYYAHSAVGCLINGKGVCESYAKAFKIFCIRENIPCVIVTSDSHEFNYVKLEDGKWYMVDCTFDDPVNGSGISECYCLVSNYPYIDSSHTPDSIFIYPVTIVNTSSKLLTTSQTNSSKTLSAPSKTAFKCAKNTSGKSITLKWKKIKSATGYLIQYSTSKLFNGYYQIMIQKNSKTAIKITRLSKGKTYYVRIRSMKCAKNAYGFSSWSKTKKIKIKK